MTDKIKVTPADETGVRYYDLGTSRDYLEQQADKKGGGAWKAIAIILAVLLVITLLGVTFGGSDSSDEEVITDTNNYYVAELFCEGTIEDAGTGYSAYANGYNHRYTMSTIDSLMEDDDNVGIIMFLKTPGGTIYESDELYLKLKEYQEETGRPYYVVMGSQCTSGGYYISANADRIYANRNTWTGSIGVTIGTIFDFSELMEKYGIKANTITSGEHKAMGSNYQEMTDEERQIWQDLINESYEQFVGIVAEGRGLTVEEVKEFADGRILSAPQAMELGLIDEYGDVDTAYADMLKELKLDEDEVCLADLKYRYSGGSLYDLIYGISETLGVQGDASSLIDLTETINQEPMSYLCEYQL